VERPELTISVHRTPSEAVVNLAGEIDMLTATRLSNTVNDILGDPPPRIVLDLAAVEEVFAATGDQIAAIITEAAAGNMGVPIRFRFV
jgi:anti-anti-sigma regulatory factor